MMILTQQNLSLPLPDKESQRSGSQRYYVESLGVETWYPYL